MKRLSLSLLALLCLPILALASGQCLGRRGLAPASTFSAPAYGYSCNGCYGGQPQQAPVPVMPPACDTCQQPQQTFAPQYAPQQYQPQYDVAPTCAAPQQQLSYAPQQYAPQASFAPQYVQRSFAPSYGVGAAFAPGYAAGTGFAPVLVRQRFFAPRFLGPPVRRFGPGRGFGVAGFGVGALPVGGFGVGVIPAFAPGFFPAAGFVRGFGLGGFGRGGFGRGFGRF